MNRRRDFFKQFIGQIGVLRDDIRGVECIPLNRLKELPGNIIEEIEPVFFPEEIWHLNDNILSVPERQPGKILEVRLNELEIKAFRCFLKGTKLKQTTINIVNDSGLNFDDTYRVVTSLFFKLASLRLCHPRVIYPINELLGSTKTE
jgi:hypothetical protein